MAWRLVGEVMKGFQTGFLVFEKWVGLKLGFLGAAAYCDF